MRSLALGLLTVLACAVPSAPPSAPPTPPSAEKPVDPRIAVLHDLQSVGLPSPLGWNRLERVQPQELGERCDRFWEQPGSGYHVRVHDDLSVDYDGQWFSQWPAAMRVPAGSYDHVVLRFFRQRAAPVAAEVAPRRGDILREAELYVHSRRRCARDHVLGSEVDAVALATWVSATGHAELARRIVSHWPPSWNPARLRSAVADAVVSSAVDSFTQGMPRAAVRSLLARADALCACGGMPEVRVLADEIGDDPTRAYDPGDAEAMLDWLADDLVLLARRPVDQLGWHENAMPRSPGLELIAMGWAALPAVVARARDPRRMRGDPQLRVGNVAVVIASEIVGKPFRGVDGLTTWWAEQLRRP